ncbi:MAG: hypothetical protein KKB77_10860 [Bacteroidetes bacterium]|nr:hypothetical protein [Bacteroidota bacterium]
MHKELEVFSFLCALCAFLAPLDVKLSNGVNVLCVIKYQEGQPRSTPFYGVLRGQPRYLLLYVSPVFLAEVDPVKRG